MEKIIYKSGMTNQSLRMQEGNSILEKGLSKKAEADR